MSYARKGLDGSDVYVYPTDDCIVCHECPLTGDNHDEQSPAGMLCHMQEHLDAGHSIPQYVIDRLQREMRSMYEDDSEDERLADYERDRDVDDDLTSTARKDD